LVVSLETSSWSPGPAEAGLELGVGLDGGLFTTRRSLGTVSSFALDAAAVRRMERKIKETRPRIEAPTFLL
jgi:hypothetical protein